MPGPYAFFRCVAEAVVARGLKGLAGCVPFGEQVYEVAADAFQRWKKHKSDAERQLELRAEFEQAASAKLDQFEGDMRRIVADVAADQPPELQQRLADYLTLIPSRIRTVFARPDDPGGTTVPLTWSLARPDDLMPILPARPPCFRVGDAVPHAKYDLVERLGLGGFGEVWKAKHRTLANRYAAFKFCLDPTSQQRILAHEADVINQVMNELDHPHIVKLQEVDFDGDAPWLQYEYVPGGDLAQLAGTWPKDLAERARLATAAIRVLAETAAHCHALKVPVIHRDFKPSNVMAAGGKLKVTDFGISDTLARQALDEARRVTVASISASTPSLVRWAHTPLYASPQQKSGDDPHRSDDVHALGVMWYQLLLGDTTLVLGADFRDDLSESGLCDELVDVLSHSVAARRKRRFASAVEMAARIAELPAVLVAPSKAKANVLHIDGLYTDADAKNAKAKQQFEARDYAAAIATLETIPVARMRDADLWERALQFRDGKRFVNSIGTPFALVKSGSFWMGGGNGKPGTQQVTIPHDIAIGVYPVTQAEWQTVMGNNPSHFARTGGGKDAVAGIPDEELMHFPVEQVSWDEVQQFLKKLNDREKLSGGKSSGWLYRLPREAEWEYICREGAALKDHSAYDFYLDRPGTTLSAQQANFGNSLQRTTKVGSYEPNQLGVYDMHGNVWEWCDDAFDGSQRVIRGGSWRDSADNCRAANRSGYAPSGRYSALGFRLARVPVGR